MSIEAGEIDDGLKDYFKQLKHIKPLSKAEERELLRRYKSSNDLFARNKIITSNLKYACKLASSYRDRGISYCDLISEANDGLIEAIDKFDLKQDVKLISYAKWWIMQKMQTAIDRKSRMPVSELPNEYEFNDSISDDIWVKPSETYDETFMSEDNDDDKFKKEFLDDLLSVLNKRELDVVNMYFGREGNEENTLEEIGKKYHLTKERVRQILEKALLKARSRSMLVDCQYLSK